MQVEKRWGTSERRGDLEEKNRDCKKKENEESWVGNFQRWGFES